MAQKNAEEPWQCRETEKDKRRQQIERKSVEKNQPAAKNRREITTPKKGA